MEAQSLNQLAIDLLDDTRRDFGVSFDDLSDQQRAELKDLYRSDMDKLAEAIETAKDRVKEASKWTIGIEGWELVGKIE